MSVSFLIKKNNALTDGNIPDRKVLANKLVNVLYKNYEEKGVEFTVTIPDLLRSLNLAVDSGNNRQKIKETIKLLQYPIELRNFNYKGDKISWISAPFLSRASMKVENSTIIHFKLDDMLIEALKQKEQYTIIDLNISNKFKTKYGIVIWEMYLRYKNQKRQDNEQWTYQSFSLEDLNRKFATKHKYTSKMLEGINRGLKEIKKITDKDITVHYIKQEKKFYFYWEREVKLSNHLKDLRTFINYIRKNFIKKPLYEFIKDGKQICYCVSEKGKIYDKYQYEDFTKDEAMAIWEMLYDKAKKGELKVFE